MMMNRKANTLLSIAFAVCSAASVALLAGCPVPQPRGEGNTYYKTCRTTNRNYWLYVPKPYDTTRRYPLVVTLHGMKPYDVSRHHVEMWGALADKHGFVILAPELTTSDTFGQFPLRTFGSAEQADVKHILACMEEVTTDWTLDRTAVMLSSWSMGGYLAHHIASEYGNLFLAFAPLQSNFSNTVCNAAKARLWMGHMSIMIFYGTVDLPVVTNESKASAEWWNHMGYNVKVTRADVGHERHPELAAEFFEAALADPRRKKLDIVVTPPNANPPPVALNLWPAMSSKIGEVQHYVWDFGKLGGPCLRQNPNVMIYQPGEYPIRLTVIDKSGQSYAAETVLKVPAVRSAAGGGPAPHTTSP
jgi:poly(3-hydroxybutyrate) depolymerase